MRTLTLDAPNERQKLFLKDRHKYIAFGGARGGGKSWAVRVKSILLALKYPGIKIMIVRKTYPELRANHIEPMRAMIGHLTRFNEVNKECRFQNGSKILFRAAQHDADLDKYQGTEVDVLFIDEATQFSSDVYKKLTACVRGVNNFPKRVYITCNPGGIGHEWVKRQFIDRDFMENERPEDYNFIQSLVTDNKILMETNPDYVAQLEALPEKLRRAWLDGDWNIFEGQFFEEFMKVPDRKLCEDAGITAEQALAQRRFTHVIEPFEIPKTWEIYRSFDFGYARPFSCDWWAVDYDGRAYLIAQLYGCTRTPNEGVKWHPDKIFAEIARIERDHRWLKGKNITGVADPSIWDRSRGDSINDFAEKHGIYFTPGDNARLPGWMQCHYRLAFDESGRPMVYFFNTCTAAIRTLPELIYSETVPEDLDTSMEDHFADSFRYFCMSRPIAPTRAPVQTVYGDDPLDLRKGW